jgi:hypothetical protein
MGQVSFCFSFSGLWAHCAVERQGSARFAIVGATLHGPFFLYGFGLIDKLPLQKIKSALGKALAKTLVTQFTLYPLFIGLFYGYVALLEGVPPGKVFEVKKKPATETLIHGLVFWPIANTVREKQRKTMNNHSGKKKRSTLLWFRLRIVCIMLQGWEWFGTRERC